MLLKIIFLGIFAENALINVLVSMLVIIFIAGLGYWALKAIPEPFPMRGWVYVIAAIFLIVLFLYFIGLIGSIS